MSKTASGVLRAGLARQGDGPAGVEPWFTDGTAAGTRLLSDVVTGAAGSAPDGFVAFGDRALFAAVNAAGTLREAFELDLSALGVASLHGLGGACPGAPELVGSGVPALGGGVQLELAGGTPLGLGALLIAPQLAPSPAIGSCSLGLLAPKFVQLVSLDGAGQGQLALGVPAASQLQGAVVRLQFAFAEPGGPLLGAFATTRVLEALIGG